MITFLLLALAEVQSDAIYVRSLFAINRTSLYRLRQKLVDAIRWLVINTRMTLLEWSFELFRHLILVMKNPKIK